MYKQDRIGAPTLLLAIVENIFGVNIYMRFLRWSGAEVAPVRTTFGDEMYVRTDDIGLSRDVALFGVREELSTAIFESELERLTTAVDDRVVVMEVGGNIGYFALLEAEVVAESGQVYAIEPNEANYELLRRNISRNGYDDTVKTYNIAIGPRNGTARLQLSKRSNWHQITTDDAPEGGTVERVEMRTLDDFVSDEGLEPGDVNVVRMDVEGYETEVFAGMVDVLSADGPLLLFVELHFHLMENDAIETLLSTLEKNGFEIVAVTRGTAGNVGGERQLSIRTFDELRERKDDDTGVRLFARRSEGSSAHHG